jgi:hypothetical protein
MSTGRAASLRSRATPRVAQRDAVHLDPVALCHNRVSHFLGQQRHHEQHGSHYYGQSVCAPRISGDDARKVHSTSRRPPALRRRARFSAHRPPRRLSAPALPSKPSSPLRFWSHVGDHRGLTAVSRRRPRSWCMSAKSSSFGFPSVQRDEGVVAILGAAAADSE